MILYTISIGTCSGCLRQSLPISTARHSAISLCADCALMTLMLPPPKDSNPNLYEAYKQQCTTAAIELLTSPQQAAYDTYNFRKEPSR